MTLEETFGSEFAEQYEQKKQQRIQEREAVSDEAKMAIANKAVEKFKGDVTEPHFQFQTENGITHDVLVMEMPDLEEGHVVARFANELDTGAVTCPLSYMGEWMSCLFNDKDELVKMEPGNEYLVIGELDQWENDKGEMNDQVSPVRGVITMDEIQKWTSGEIDHETSETPDMDAINEPDADEGSEGDSEDDGGEKKVSFGSGSDDEEEASLPRGRMEEEIKLVAEHQEEVMDIEGSDDERADDLTSYLIDEIDDLSDDDFDDAKSETLDILVELKSDDEEEEEETSSEDIFS